MARKDYTPEQAIGMLREAEVRLSQGEKIGKICRGLGICELLQPMVLPLKVLQPARLIDFQAAINAPPAIVALIRIRMVITNTDAMNHMSHHLRPRSFALLGAGQNDWERKSPAGQGGARK
jgi:hypothetical protein